MLIGRQFCQYGDYWAKIYSDGTCGMPDCNVCVCVCVCICVCMYVCTMYVCMYVDGWMDGWNDRRMEV